ncbi:MAG TPA: hypothetical protein VK933_10370 [Longimicrobiales bacterium]|nr:hypothetical protein [Longimicrobiales bacterium]
MGDLRGDHQQQSNIITNTGKRTEPSSPTDDERVLRAKYLDWCSAQVADHFLALSPDEIFELAERSSRDDAPAAERPASPVPPEGDDLSSYRGVVERVTEVLTQQLELPSFAEWLELYRRNPSAVEARLLGFWKDAR